MVTRFEPGELQTPELVIQWSLPDAHRVVHRLVSGTEALAMTTVSHDGATGPPAPIDLAARPELVAMRRLPSGADLAVQYRYTGGPFGDVSFATSFVAGQVDAMLLGELADPDLVIEVPFLAAMALRRGDISIYDTLDHGRVAKGDVGPLALLAGLIDNQAYHGAEVACGPSGMVLGRLGAATMDEAVVDALHELGLCTEVP